MLYVLFYEQNVFLNLIYRQKNGTKLYPHVTQQYLNINISNKITTVNEQCKMNHNTTGNV